MRRLHELLAVLLIGILLACRAATSTPVVIRVQILEPAPTSIAGINVPAALDTQTPLPTVTADTAMPAPTSTSTSASTIADTQTALPATRIPALPPTPQAVTQVLDAYLSSLSAAGNFDGSVLVAQSGKVLLDKGYGLADRETNVSNTPQTRYGIASITKQFTAMAILMLQAQNKLAVHDPICAYIDACPDAWKAITIHQLLTHTSGIPDFANFPDYDASALLPLTPVQMLARFKDLPLDFEPGTQWRYSNSGYVVLGAIIEKVSGQSYEAFLQTQIFTPLQMTETGYFHYGQAINGLAAGYTLDNQREDDIDIPIFYAAGALYSTVYDLYRWDEALYSAQLLPQPLIETMFQPYVLVPNDSGVGYGYGWYVDVSAKHPLISHSGNIDGFADWIGRYPSDKATIIVLSNREMDLTPVTTSLANILFGEQ